MWNFYQLFAALILLHTLLLTTGTATPANNHSQNCQPQYYDLQIPNPLTI